MTDKTAVATALTRVLGNTYVLYAKTHSFHWNVTGPQFHALHTMFEEQYRSMWESLDVLAERLRALDTFAPASSGAMGQAASLTESGDNVPAASAMLGTLIEDHESWLNDAQEALGTASAADDTGTEDVLTPLIAEHEKMRWMLKASLGA